MNKIGYEIKTLDNMIERKIIMDAKKTNAIILTPIHAKIIEYLLDNQNHDVFQRDIENNFLFRKSTASGILSTMEKNNLIKRIEIGRRKKIILTEKSLQRIKDIKSHVLEFEELLSKNINKEELNIFYKVIAQIKENISNKEE